MNKMKTPANGRASTGNGYSRKKGNQEGQEPVASGSKGTPASGGAQSGGTAVSLNGKIKAEHYQSDREAFLNAFESKLKAFDITNKSTKSSNFRRIIQQFSVFSFFPSTEPTQIYRYIRSRTLHSVSGIYV